MLLTVRRAGEVLDLFQRQGEWGVSAIAAELGIAKSQSHELLTSLCFIGLLRRSARGRYRLGWGAVSLGEQLLRQEFRGRRALAVRRLAASSGQYAHLLALDRSRVVTLAAQRGAEAKTTTGGFDADCLHCTAAGKLLLANQDPAIREELLARKPQARTARTIVSPAELRPHLEEIERRGVSYDLGESSLERRAVSVAVRTEDGGVLAALSLTASADRWRVRRREFEILLRREANLLSHDLRGGAEPAKLIDELSAPAPV